MKNWKACEEDSLWGFVMWGPYYAQISQDKKNHMEIGGGSSVPCGVYKSINPSFDFFNWKSQWTS
jgi:hypothetical protein